MGKLGYMQCNPSDWNLLRMFCKSTVELAVITFLRMSAVQDGIPLTGTCLIVGTFIRVY